MRLRLPRRETIERVRPALLGLGAGLVGMLVVAALSAVIYSGRGLWQPAATPPQVYTGF